MNEHEKINYVELPAENIQTTKKFFAQVFGWLFEDFGPDYIAFSNSGLQGGFEKSEDPITTGALVILYHSDLESIKESVIKSKGVISQDIFSFPGGRRFHFIDPSGNELAIWSDK